MRNAIYNSDFEDDGSESCAIPSTAATRRRTTASGVGLFPDYEPQPCCASTLATIAGRLLRMLGPAIVPYSPRSAHVAASGSPPLLATPSSSSRSGVSGLTRDRQPSFGRFPARMLASAEILGQVSRSSLWRSEKFHHHQPLDSLDREVAPYCRRALSGRHAIPPSRPTGRPWPLAAKLLEAIS